MESQVIIVLNIIVSIAYIWVAIKKAIPGIHKCMCCMIGITGLILSILALFDFNIGSII